MEDDQVTIFDVLPNENQPDFRNMTDEEIVRQIALTTGLVFKDVGLRLPGQKILYRAQVGTSGCDIHTSTYALKERRGEKFIACDIWLQNGWEGCAVTCDSIEEAVDLIRKKLLERR